MYSAYKLNKQGDNIQPWRIPFPNWNQSVFPYLVLTVASWPAYRFLRRQVRWSGIPVSQNFPQFVVIHTVKGFGVINKAEVDVFLELSCFFNDPTDVGNLISGSFVFSKSSLNIRKFLVHVLLKPGLENFEHYFTSVWDECNCVGVWAFFGIAFLWDWNENTFSSPVATAEFPKFAGIFSATLSQHHLLGFEVAQLEIHHLHYSPWCRKSRTQLNVLACMHHDILPWREGSFLNILRKTLLQHNIFFGVTLRDNEAWLSLLWSGIFYVLIYNYRPRLCDHHKTVDIR